LANPATATTTPETKLPAVSGVGGGVFRDGGGVSAPVLLYRVEPGSVSPVPKTQQ